ncbi:MAG: hypothetical protein QNJ77_04655 [Acidimicrobiia bacterium]|nr:hypothetical protein [Acidimicrobiia bacterium]
MGQSITVASKELDGFCVFTTDRSISGQTGASFGSAAEAESATGFPAALAERLFAADHEIDHVYVASNDVIVRRSDSWNQATVAAATGVIEDLFRHYDG